LLLDAEGLSKAATGQPLVRAYLEAAQALGADVFVSAVTLAETVRGGAPDARVFRVLNAATVIPVSAEVGRAAGELLGATDRDDTVDAVVAATARSLHRPIRVLTSDPRDLRALTEGYAEVEVVPV
jgi:predicted nucleic acid-binding protein